MTMPNVPTRVIELPRPGYPMLVLLVTDNLDSQASKDSSVHWVLSKPHPFMPGMNVARMFVVDRGGVEVYSTSSDGKTYGRDFIPMDRIQLTHETMPLEVFVEELAAAEEGDDPDPDPNFNPDPEGPETAPPPPPNGQTTS